MSTDDLSYSVAIASIPECEPSISTATVLCSPDCLWVAYDAKGANWPNGADNVALVRLANAVGVRANGPNDEAFHNDPTHSLGAEHYKVQEIINSSRIGEVLAMLHKYRAPTMLGYRHFVFALKETTIDCVASSIELVGVHESHAAALKIACAELNAS